MGKVWVLDTATKGTGASVIPLERSREEPAREDRAPVVPAKARRRPPRRQEPAPPRRPRRFKVIDVMSRETLAEGARLRAILDLLREVRSPVDVRISLWDDVSEDWRLLTLAQQRALWDAARRAGGVEGDGRRA